MRNMPKGLLEFMIWCVLVVVTIVLFATRFAFAETHDISTTRGVTDGELGVVVTNDTDANIVVSSTGGVQGCTVAPGATCLVPYPPGWPWLTVRVERYNNEGDFFGDSEERHYKTDEMGKWKVRPHRF